MSDVEIDLLEAEVKATEAGGGNGKTEVGEGLGKIEPCVYKVAFYYEYTGKPLVNWEEIKGFAYLQGNGMTMISVLKDYFA